MAKFVFINRFFYPDHSATAQILADLAFAWAESDNDVHVVTSRHCYDKPSVLYPVFEVIRGVAIHRVASTGFARSSMIGRASNFASFYVTAALELVKLVRPGDVVIAKTDPPLISVVAAAVCKLKGAILINWLQDLYPDVAVQCGLLRRFSFSTRLFAALRNASLRNARVNVAVGTRMARKIAAADIDSSVVRVISNWADDTLIRPVDETQNSLRREWMLDKSFVVGYSGNLGRAHEADTVLHAAELLRHRRDIRFLFVGGGYRRSFLENEVRKRQLHNFTFNEYQSRGNLSQSLSAPDIHWLSIRPEFDELLVPSKFYGIAAAGRGIICITSSDNELARLIRRYDCGEVVRPGDVEGLARIISQLADDPVKVRAWGMRAREMLEVNFTREKCIKAWSNVLSEVA